MRGKGRFVGISVTQSLRIRAEWLLGVIVALFVVAHVPNLAFGFPEIVLKDENTYAGLAFEMLSEGSFDPGDYTHGGNLIHYLYLFFYYLLYVTGRFFGLYSSDGELPRWHFYLLSRVLALGCAAGSLVLLYRMGCWLFDWTVALAACLFLALNPEFFYYAMIGKLDIFTFAIGLGASVVFLRIVDEESSSKASFVLAGLHIGAGIAFKYVMGALSVALFTVFLAARRTRHAPDARPRWRWLFVSYGIAAAVFCVSSPFVLINIQQTIDHIALQYRLTVAGINPMSETLTSLSPWNVLTVHLPHAMGWVAVPLGLVFWLWAFYRYRWRWLAVTIFPVLYYLIVFRMSFAFPRELLPLYPTLSLATAWGAVTACRRLAAIPGDSNNLMPWAFAALVGVGFLQPAETIFKTQRRMYRGDTTVQAKNWFLENIPPGAKIARDSYALPMREHYEELYRHTLAEESYEFYVEQGVKYLVTSKLPAAVTAARPKLVKHENQFEKRGEKLAEWDPVKSEMWGYPIVIYRVTENTDKPEQEIP